MDPRHGTMETVNNGTLAEPPGYVVPATIESTNSTDQALETASADSESPSDEPSAAAGLSPSTRSRVLCHNTCTHQDLFVFCASCLAAIGGLLFGYDTGIISGAMLQLGQVFDLSCHQKELVISAMLIGALIAALVAGTVVDRFGRKFAVIINAVIFTVGSIVMATSVSFSMMIVGRLIIGFAVSLSAIAECIYISEISPVNKRGFLVSINEFCITVGFLLAYLVNYLLISMPNGWRYMFGLGVLPAVVQGIGMLFMPQSPRYLLLQRDQYKARSVMLKLRACHEVDAEMREIEAAIDKERNLTYLDLCRPKNNMLGRMLIGFGLVIFQQVTGQPNMLYYAPTIFQLLGFQSSSAATLATVGLGIIKVLFTGIALYHLDKCGRRKLLFGGIGMMMVSILTLGIVTQVWRSNFLVIDPCPHLEDNVTHPNQTITHEIVFNNPTNPSKHDLVRELNSANNLFHVDSKRDYNEMLIMKRQVGDDNVTGVIPYNSSSSYSTLGNDGTLDVITEAANTSNSSQPAFGTSISRACIWITFFSLMTFVAGYALSFGPGTWLILSEIFPVIVRGRALSCALIINWLTNLIITVSFLDTMSGVGVPATFLSYGVVCGCSIVFILLFVPETKGKSLEEITSELQNWSFKKQAKDALCCTESPSDGYPQYEHIDVEMSSPIVEY